MSALLLTPPLAFILILALSWGLSFWSSGLAYKRKDAVGAFNKAYASGEDIKQHRVQPDYSQFFPFAFFFTILHVVTLILATAPTHHLGAFVIAMIYVFGAILGLLILFRGN